MRVIIAILLLHLCIVLASVFSNNSYNFYSETYIRDLKLAKCIYNSERNKSIVLGSSRSLMGYGIENKVINYALPGGGYIEATDLMKCISNDANILFPLEYDRFDTNYIEYQHQSPIWKAYRNFGILGGGLAHLFNFGLSFDFLIGLTKRVLHFGSSSFNNIGMGQGGLLISNDSVEYDSETWKLDMSLKVNNNQLLKVDEICKDTRTTVFFHPMISYAKNSSSEPSILLNDNELSLIDFSKNILTRCKNKKDIVTKAIIFHEPALFYDYSHLKPELGNSILNKMNLLD